MNKYTIYCVIALSLLWNSAIAIETKDKQLEYRSITEQKLVKEESRRQQWRLSKAEWTRYKTLMNGIRGSISPKNISPIEVLGTHARSADERRKYAEIWAQMRHDDIDKIIAFQNEYNAAFVRLYPNQPMIDTQLLNLAQPSKGNKEERILVFLKIEQCPRCETVIQQVISDETRRDVHLDIYFVGTKNKIDDKKIRTWAKDHNLDAQRLKTGSITLNHDQGTLYKVTKKRMSAVPIVFSFNTKKLTQIHY